MFIDSMIIQTIINGLMIGAIYVLFSMGLSFSFGVMHLINVAQGDLVVLGAFIAYWLYIFLHIDPLLSSPFIFFIFFIFGYLLQKYAVNRIIEAPPLMNLVFFFGLSILIANLGLITWGPFTRMLTTELSGASINLGTISIPIIRLMAFLVSILSIVILYVFLKKTRIGLAIIATSQNKEAARLMGINVENMYAITLGIGFGTAGLAGALIAQIISFHPMIGPILTLFAFFVTVLGGMGYLLGTLVGGFILGLLQSFIITYYRAAPVYFVIFIILYMILLLRPKGIFGKGV